MATIYTLTSVLSAFLVFLIQPVVAKIALPTLGGTPMVWNGCMVFFQAMLLLGYGYAHAVSRLPIKRQPLVHGALLIAALASFPIGFHAAEVIDPAYMPLRWLLLTLATSVGLPFFAISASSPLLQQWFSKTDHPHAHHPYFLYAASNVGSMGALLTYPFWIESHARLSEQVRGWELGIAVLAVFWVAVALRSWRRWQPAVAPSLAITPSEAPRWKQRVYWMMLAFVPSSLLYGVTTYISTDLVSVPMLWLVPLMLYLLTFILVFGERIRGVKLARRVQMPAVLFTCLLLAMPGSQQPIFFLVHLLAFFIVSMALHGQLSQSKPNPAHLTEFFIWMSLGGVLGGMFNTFVAPHIFNMILEYPLMLLASCAMRVRGADMIAQCRQHGLRAMLWCGGILALFFLIWHMLGAETGLFFGEGKLSSVVDVLRVGFLAGAALFAARFDRYPAVWALGVGTLLLGAGKMLMIIVMGNQLYEERGVFGVNRVMAHGPAHVFVHGTTIHGMQVQSGPERLQPNSYYWMLKDVFASLPANLHQAPVAVMGLGTGTVACHGKPGQIFDFFEIDPIVAKIAQDTRFFTYLQDCPPESHVLLGDARRRMAQQEDARYGLIVVDTFSSDAIPVHMMTQEAIALFARKLQPGGMLALHVSNRYMDLRPVLSAIAEKLNMHAVARGPVQENQGQWVQSSNWVVLAPDQRSTDALISLQDHWAPLAPEPQALWTDDFSNIVSSLIAVRQWRGQ